LRDSKRCHTLSIGSAGDRRGDDDVDVRVRRVYEPAADDDGYRVLVDRLWPRGVAKAAAQVDEWCRTVAPSSALRTWYGHDPQRFPEFRRRYRAELESGEAAAALERLRAVAERGPLTLLTATRDPATSNAAVVAELVRQSR
jgi:uncharacterized protein YeaO (DUF488 family)